MGEIDDGVEAAVWFAFGVVEAHEAQAAGDGVSGGVCLESVLARLDEGDGAEGGLVA